MSTVFTEPINLADLVKYEEASQGYSRDIVTAAPNLTLALGTVVGFMNDIKQIRALTVGVTDGSQNACGVLIHAIDTRAAGNHDTVILARHAVGSPNYLVWPIGITAEDKATAIAQLKTLGILIRQGA
jgi:hypothetical protein